MDILKSASKVVFVLMAVAVCVLTYVGTVDPKDFLMLSAMAFSFYFSNKGNADEKYLGK